MHWSEIASRRAAGPPSAFRRAVGLTVPFAVAGFLAILGLGLVAVAVALAGAVVAVLALAVPPVAIRIEGVLATFARVVARGLTVVLLGTLELLVFLPLAVVGKVFRRDPLTAGRAPGDGHWHDRRPAGRGDHRRTFANEPLASRRPWRRVAYGSVRVVGVVLILAALNYGVGWTWDEYLGTHDTPLAVSGGAASIADLRAAPAVSSASWAGAYWHAFAGLDYEFLPCLMSRVRDVDGRFITSRGGVRRSFEPSGAPHATPEVWFLGGAALWGEGQRDLRTIPSDVARLAASEGSPLHVVNLGQPGYTSWQSALLLEQQLAVRPAPDAVVFYDGADDVAVQLERPSDDPTHYNVRGAGLALLGRDSARDQVRDWWQEYRDRSVVNRLLQGVQGIFGAQPAAADSPGLADRVADLHARSVDLASYVASRHGVETLFTWQASSGVPGDRGAYRRVAAQGTGVTNGAVDLSRVLDDEPQPVFLDGVLTNERGARVVAEALWAHLQPVVD